MAGEENWVSACDNNHYVVVVVDVVTVAIVKNII